MPYMNARSCRSPFARALWVWALVTGLPVRAESTLEQATALFEAHHYAQALPLLERQVREAPSDPEAQFELGTVYLDQDQSAERALLFLQKAVALNSRNSRYWTGLGVAYGVRTREVNLFRAMGMASKSKDALERAVELDPSNIEAHLALMQFFLVAPGIAGGSVARAQRQALVVVSLNPGRGYLALGSIGLQQKKLPEAEVALRKALAMALKPADKGEAHNELGYVYLAQKRSAEALTQFQEYVKVQPQDPNAYDSLAGYYFQQDQVAAAEANYRQAISLNPGFAHAHFGLAGCKERLGDKAAAREVFQRFLAQVPRSADADEARAHLKRL